MLTRSQILRLSACNYLERKVEWDKNDPPAGCRERKYALCLHCMAEITQAAASKWLIVVSGGSRGRQWLDEQNLIIGLRLKYQRTSGEG